VKSFDAIVSSYKQVQSYRNESVSQDLITTLVQASRVVPYGFHLQPTHYYVVTDVTLKEKICKACFNKPLVLEAPAIVIFTGDRFTAREQELILDEELEKNAITVDEAERLRLAKALHFDTGPVGMGWLGKSIGGPLLHLFSTMPQLPCVHKREWLTRQVMRSVMTFFWAAESHNLAAHLVDSYDEWRIKWALNIPWHHIVVSVMLIGYSQDQAKNYIPFALEDLLHWNKS
jgi:nitroreductase